MNDMNNIIIELNSFHDVYELLKDTDNNTKGL